MGTSTLLQEEDQRLSALPLRTIEHILALLPAAVGDMPRERVPSQAGKADSGLTGANVRMAAASTIANLSRSLANRCLKAAQHVIPLPGSLLCTCAEMHVRWRGHVCPLCLRTTVCILPRSQRLEHRTQARCAAVQEQHL